MNPGQSVATASGLGLGVTVVAGLTHAVSITNQNLNPSLTLYVFCGTNPKHFRAEAAIRGFLHVLPPENPRGGRAVLKFRGPRAFEKRTESNKGSAP